MTKRAIFIILLFSGLISCTTDNVLLPDILVDEYVYLNNPSNINLQAPGGWAYVSGGIKGIIVYRVSIDQFKAYERSCPHISPNMCSVLYVEKGITVECECDKKTFLLATGEPLDGASHGLKEYRAYLIDDGTLRIVN
jgi:nitrite reductase/ring-hydroxylating ferredoxin subunit